MSQIHSFPKVYNLGHPAIADLFTAKCEVTEKVDGSQFSFSVGNKGQLHLRSKGAVIHEGNVPDQFKRAVAYVQSYKDQLIPGWVYRGEAFNKPKHNALAYERMPVNGVMLFGIERRENDFMSYEDMAYHAMTIDLETVPLIGYTGVEFDEDQLMELLDRKSILGGAMIEGLVFKNYVRFGRDGKVLMGKYVAPRFRELHAAAWKQANPSKSDLVEVLAQALRSEARWEKAVARLRDVGELTNSPKDIGPLMKSVQQDVLEEEEERIKQKLFDWAWRKKLSRATTAGLAEWYKDRLLKQQFEDREPRPWRE